MKKVILTTGYEVEIGEGNDWLEHLFNAVLGESLEATKELDVSGEERFFAIYNACMLQLHFIAGQFLQMEESLELPYLLEEFGVYWDRVGEKFGGKLKE